MEVNSKNSTIGSIFPWLVTPEEAFIWLTIKLEPEDEHAASNADQQVEPGCSGGVRREEGGGRHDASFTPGADHFGYSPAEITSGHLGTLEHDADLLKRGADITFKKGGHAA
jgi:hypothetical protein